MNARFNLGYLRGLMHIYKVFTRPNAFFLIFELFLYFTPMKSLFFYP